MNSIVQDLNAKRINYDETWATEVRDKFCRKEENIRETERQFFSQYWQGFAWAAIIGFIKDRRSPLDPKTKNSSFNFQVITNNAPKIADALILLAIAKSGCNYEILMQPDEIATIMSEYAKGGAEYIKEIRETPETENFFDNEDDFRNELLDRA